MPTQPAYAQISARTGEPRRPVIVWLVLLCSFVSIGWLFTSLLYSFWVAVETFNEASLLTELIPTEFGSGWRILLAVALTAIGLLPSISAVISGYYVFAGYRWARVATIITFVVSGLGVLLNIFAYPAIGLTFVAAVLSWLPPAKRYYASWRLLRHRETAFSPPVSNVYYGPLTRYLDVRPDQNGNPGHA
jgi:MFS family permease